MKRVHYFIFTVLILSTVSCTNSLKQYKLDMLICESAQDKKLTEEQIQMLLPIEKDKEIFLAQGNIFSTKGEVSYTKEKGFWERIGGENVNSPFFVLKEEVNSHLGKLDLSPIYLPQPLSVDDVKRNIANYDVVLGYGSVKSENSSFYTFKFFANSESITSYIIDTVFVKNPGAKVVVVYNPPIINNPNEGKTDITTTLNGSSLPEGEQLRQELLKIIDIKRSKQEREKIAAQVWDEYFYPDVYIQNLSNLDDKHPEYWNPGNGKSYLAHLVTLPSIIDIKIISIERDKETNKISGLKVVETRNKSFISN